MHSIEVSFKLSQLAKEHSLALKGPDCVITGIASLNDASPGKLSYLKDSKLLETARNTSAGALIVPKGIEATFPCPVIESDDPYLSFILISSNFISPYPVHKKPSLSWVHQDAIVHPTAEIGPFVTVSPGCKIGPGVRIHAGVKLMENVSIGKSTVLYSNSVVFPGCKIGQNCIIGANTVIGGEGFGFHFAKGRHNKVPQTGIVRIGDDVEIGSCVSIDRGTFTETSIGDGSKIDNQVQIAHNVTIGKHVIVVAQAGISGSTSIGDYAVLAGKAGLVGHIHIGSGATVGGGSVVTKSVPDGRFVIGYPATEHRIWKKQMASLARLPKLAATIRHLLQEKKKNKGKE
ncbi:MAG: UDP-3-O-(3-hydroxymyristoyl)glucosamine N-acyltransferase [Acidobacteria bacterium]|nr:MAG: UDP-3-O-(3-hydroxymyristoyl)glucosamine N-acyltransferase [Acidobacteriota bacterium]